MKEIKTFLPLKEIVDVSEGNEGDICIYKDFVTKGLNYILFFRKDSDVFVCDIKNEDGSNVCYDIICGITKVFPKYLTPLEKLPKTNWLCLNCFQDSSYTSDDEDHLYAYRLYNIDWHEMENYGVDDGCAWDVDDNWGESGTTGLVLTSVSENTQYKECILYNGTDKINATELAINYWVDGPGGVGQDYTDIYYNNTTSYQLPINSSNIALNVAAVLINPDTSVWNNPQSNQIVEWDIPTDLYTIEDNHIIWNEESPFYPVLYGKKLCSLSLEVE